LADKDQIGPQPGNLLLDGLLRAGADRDHNDHRARRGDRSGRRPGAGGG
jgi:hypothetical protein